MDENAVAISNLLSLRFWNAGYGDKEGSERRSFRGGGGKCGTSCSLSPPSAPSSSPLKKSGRGRKTVASKEMSNDDKAILKMAQSVLEKGGSEKHEEIAKKIKDLMTQ